MTRLSNTEEEKIAGGALLAFLSESGRDVEEIPRQINDRPDMCFRLNSMIIGCECVQIPPGHVYKYIHSRFKQLDKSKPSAVQIVWPQEQHYWISSAIKSKKGKIDAYRKNTNADQIWLLIHSPVSEKDSTVRYAKPEIMNLIKYGAKSTPNDFDAIYFWDPLHGVTQLSPIEGGWDNVNFDLKDGYPTDGFLMSVAKFTTTEEGADPIELDLGVVKPEVIIVPPQDPSLKGHKPRYVNKEHRIKILVGATTAQITVEPVEEWKGSKWDIKDPP